MKLRDFQLYSCVSSKGDIMRIQHGHESQDLTKVYHGTSHRNPALGGTPGFHNQCGDRGRDIGRGLMSRHGVETWPRHEIGS